jgi:hypothetical protein
MQYTPNPIKTDHIVLTSNMQNLVKNLAENTHHIWA